MSSNSNRLYTFLMEGEKLETNDLQNRLISLDIEPEVVHKLSKRELIQTYNTIIYSNDQKRLLKIKDYLDHDILVSLMNRKKEREIEAGVVNFSPEQNGKIR